VLDAGSAAAVCGAHLDRILAVVGAASMPERRYRTRVAREP
jgi:hypothetical protein